MQLIEAKLRGLQMHLLTNMISNHFIILFWYPFSEELKEKNQKRIWKCALFLARSNKGTLKMTPPNTMGIDFLAVSGFHEGNTPARDS